MLLDANDLENGATFSADLCIVGAGAAGVTLAHALGDSPLSILLLESGGLVGEDATQALYEGSYAGNLPHLDARYLKDSRLRLYGGTTNFWGGYCRPLEPLDFEARAWVAESGWPISRADLDPYYRAASSLLGLDVFDEGPLTPNEPALAPQFGGESFDERLYQFRYVNIGAEHIDEFRASTRVTLILHSNALDLVTTAEGRAVDHVEIATLAGKRFQARARAFVIATGGIENARLLLASRGVHPSGIGNDHDLVGRFFMEHVLVPVGVHHLAFVWQNASLKRYRPVEPSGSVVPANGRNVAHLVSPTEVVARERRLLNVVANLTSELPVGTHAFTEFEQALIHASHDLDGRCKGSDALPPQEVGIGFTCEQAPNFDSRIKLSEDRDPLGMPRVQLEWRVGDLELDTVQTFAELLAAEIARRRLGRMRISVRDDLRPWIAGGHHHMGTTRMHSDPKRGVVDANCRIHGVDNLFVAGSSVFSTGGSANPTYTLLALALRLADHLRGWLS